MLKSRAIRLDLQGFNRVMNVGGPSALNTTLKRARKVYKINPIKVI
jgi:hypothetical protein